MPSFIRFHYPKDLDRVTTSAELYPLFFKHILKYIIDYFYAYDSRLVDDLIEEWLFVSLECSNA